MSSKIGKHTPITRTDPISTSEITFNFKVFNNLSRKMHYLSFGANKHLPCRHQYTKAQHRSILRRRDIK